MLRKISTDKIDPLKCNVPLFRSDMPTSLATRVILSKAIKKHVLERKYAREKNMNRLN